MIKVIHTGDIHLDSPFTGLGEDKAEVRKTELRGTFASLMTYVRMNAVDILLITGDLFDRGFVTRETVSIVLREFSHVPGCRIIISPGNHDPYTPSSIYERVKFPDNVYIFKDEEMSRFEFPELGVDVYGYAFTSESMTECKIGETEDNGRVKLLCAHADLGAAVSNYAPVSVQRLTSCGFDYAALGHIHNPPPIAEANGCRYGYCGCLEGRSYDETGRKSAVYIQIDGGKIQSVSGIGFSKRRYESDMVDVGGAGSLPEITDRIRTHIKNMKYGAETLLRVRLVGEIPDGLVIFPGIISNDIGEVFALEVIDETSPAIRGDYLMEDPTVKGAFYRALLPSLESDDPETRRCARRALRYGLAAMSGESISDV